MQESKVLRDSQLASFAKIADFFLLVAEFVFAEIAEKRLLKAGFRAGKALAVVGDGTPLEGSWGHLPPRTKRRFPARR